MSLRLRISTFPRFTPIWVSFIKYVHGDNAEQDWRCWHRDNIDTLRNLPGYIVEDGNSEYVMFDSEADLAWFLLKFG